MIHQGNELIFKHSFGQDYQFDDELSLNELTETKILTLNLSMEGSKTKLDAKLNNLLFIFESMACLQILQNVTTLKSIIAKSLGIMSSRSKTSYSVNLEQSLEPAPAANNEDSFELGIALSACNV